MNQYLRAFLVGAGIGSAVLNAYLLREIYKETKRLEEETEETLDVLAWKNAYNKISEKVRKFGIYADFHDIAKEIEDEYKFQKIAVHEK